MLCAGPSSTGADPAKQLLLGYLADRRRGDAELCASAREFMLCQAFADEVTDLQKADASDEDLIAALVKSRETCDVLKRGSSNDLSAGEHPSPSPRHGELSGFFP